jgi:hypothetical protein
LHTPLLYSGDIVTDRDKWRQAVVAVTSEYAALVPSLRERLRLLCESIITAKRCVHAVTEAVSPAAICAACGGACCASGKYHFTVVDLLVFLDGGHPLFEPQFGRGLCPYLGERSCLMEPGYRPFNCLTFNCELVEALLAPSAVERFYAGERELRRLYAGVEELFGNRFMHGLLMNYERGLLTGMTTPLLTACCGASNH